MVSPDRVDPAFPDGSGEPESVIESRASAQPVRSFYAQQQASFDEVCPQEGERIIDLDSAAHAGTFEKMSRLLQHTLNPPSGVSFVPLSVWTAEDKKDFTLLFEARDLQGRSLEPLPRKTGESSQWVAAPDSSKFALVAHFLAGADSTLLALPPSPFMTPEYLEAQITAFIEARPNILERQLERFITSLGFDASKLKPLAERSAGCGLSLEVAYRSGGKEDGQIEVVVGLSADAEFTPLEAALLYQRSARALPSTSAAFVAAQKFVDRAVAKGGWARELELTPPSQLSGSALSGVIDDLKEELDETLSTDQKDNAELTLHYLVFDPTRSSDARLVFSLYDESRTKYIVPGIDMQEGLPYKEFIGVVWELSDPSNACRASEEVECAPPVTLDTACAALCSKGKDSTTLTDAGYIVSQKTLSTWIADAESRPWESILGQQFRGALLYYLANEGIIDEEEEVELASFAIETSIIPEPPAAITDRLTISALITTEHGQHIVHARYFPTDNFLDLSELCVVAGFSDGASLGPSEDDLFSADEDSDD